MVDLLGQCQATFPLARLAQPMIAAQDPHTNLRPGVAGLVTETLIFDGHVLYNMSVQVGACRHDH